MSDKRDTVFKVAVVALVIAIIAMLAVFLLKKLGFTNIDVLRAYVNKGAWGMAAYVFIQIFQVVFIPISTSMFTIPAIILFGPVKGFFVCWAGCTIGSVLLFIIARTMRERALKWVIGTENAEKFKSLLSKGKYLLPAFLLIPVFPDDIMCASAGLSNIKLLYFIAVITITRAIDAAFTAFIGTALVRSAWGIALICVFFLSMLVLSVYLTKNRERVEGWITQKLTKKSKS